MTQVKTAVTQVKTPVTAGEAPTPAEAFGDETVAPSPPATEEVTSLSDITHVPLPAEHESYASAITDVVRSFKKLRAHRRAADCLCAYEARKEPH